MLGAYVPGPCWRRCPISNALRAGLHDVSDDWKTKGTVEEMMEAYSQLVKTKEKEKRIAYYRALAQACAELDDDVEDEEEMLDCDKKHDSDEQAQVSTEAEGKQEFSKLEMLELEERKEATLKLIIAENQKFLEFMDGDNDEDKTGEIRKLLGNKKKNALTEVVEVSIEEEHEHKKARLTKNSQNKGEDVDSGETKSAL